ncbi:SpoIIE family protein phosphatase [Streptomyces sp. GbtcB7]|uniref:SpoIIE family protein phosphatase n=1 Tax=Streptomyces sp. GbtcB7 TaxID=2824752 RepID=UPI001C305324|nr:SpoIIE family protein phosphatase [Streptomyces sp. GbtcB7]
MDSEVSWHEDDSSRTRELVTGVVSVDAKGIVTMWNAAAQQLLGHPPGDVVGRAAADLLASGLPASARTCLTARTEWSGTLSVQHLDGRHVDLALRAFPQRDAHGDAGWVLITEKPHTAMERPGLRNTSDALRDWTLSQLPIAVSIHDYEGRVTVANVELLRLLGMREETLLGHRLDQLRAGLLCGDMARAVFQVLRTGEPVHKEVSTRSPGETRPRTWSLLVSPLKDPTGLVHGASTAALDITETERARWRLDVVNEASIRIGTTLEVVRTAEELAELAVDRLADFAAIDLLDPVYSGEEPKPGGPADATAMRRAANRSVLDGCPEATFKPGELSLFQEGSPLLHSLASGRATRHSSTGPKFPDWLAENPRQASMVSTFGLHSVLLVPLRARGTPLGFGLFARHRNPEPFDDDDLLLAEEITGRAAVCVDNARRYTRERSTSLTLQRSLLPHQAPKEAAVDVASRYLPTGSQAGVGGDWFDVIPLSGARVALVVGDVVGHGIHASATMGRLRTAVRTLADVDLPPDELLTCLDDLVLRLDREEEWDGDGSRPQAAGDVGATCLYAVYDPVSSRCTIARAGHPPPALVSPDGTVEFPDLPAGPPLGLGGFPFESAVLDLPEGSLIALYTDGLVEAADQDIEVGIEKLRRAVAAPGRTLEEICDAVLGQLLPDRPTDDVALLIARTHALDSSHVATWQLPADPAVVAVARKQAVERLSSWGLEAAAFVTELVVSELVTNAIRYGGAPIQLRLIRARTLICEVSDASSTSPHLRRARAFDEGGRGLLLVAQLTDRWGTRHTVDGKTIWAEQTLPQGL